MKAGVAAALSILLAFASATAPAEAAIVSVKTPGGQAAVEHDTTLWRAQTGGKVLFLTCRHPDCGGENVECAFSTLPSKTPPDRLTDVLVVTMAPQLIADWSGRGVSDMSIVEEPRSAVHGANSGAFATFSGVKDGAPHFLTFFYAPAKGFVVSATCFIPVAKADEGTWEAYKLLAGIQIQ